MIVYPEASADYQPGTCNIGAAEIRRRWLGGHVGVIAAAVMLVGLVAIGAPPITRLIIALPAAGAAVSYLQAHLRFCAAFGLRGTYNFGRPGSEQPVADESARASDRRRALQVALAGALVGAIVGLVAVALPI
jgi:hypothetical protein